MNSTDRPYLGQGCQTPYSFGELFRQRLWSLVQSTLFRWSPRSWHAGRARLLILFGADIPEPRRVVIFPTVRIYFPWKLSLAPRSMIGRHVNLYNLDRISLGYGANLSQNCHLCAGTHDFKRWEMPLVTRPITIGDNAWLAADVFVGPGVTVGELCVVGARSVVMRDLPPHTIAVGNPCHVVRERSTPA